MKCGKFWSLCVGQIGAPLYLQLASETRLPSVMTFDQPELIDEQLKREDSIRIKYTYILMLQLSLADKIERFSPLTYITVSYTHLTLPTIYSV